MAEDSFAHTTVKPRNSLQGEPLALTMEFSRRADSGRGVVAKDLSANFSHLFSWERRAVSACPEHGGLKGAPLSKLLLLWLGAQGPTRWSLIMFDPDADEIRDLPSASEQ
jgi:hypothetical protein